MIIDPAARKTLVQLSEIALGLNQELWIVGGFIRDSLCGLTQSHKDLDLVIEGESQPFINAVVEKFGCEFKTFQQFLTAKFICLPGFAELDIASLRTETYSKPGSLPEVKHGTFLSDLLRRDFTINALYLRLRDFIENDYKIEPKLLIDKLASLEDIEKRVIRILHDRSFIEDPSRLFRAIRYCAKIGGSMSHETQLHFDLYLSLDVIESMSKHRIITELKKACSEELWAPVVKGFAESGLLSISRLLNKDQFDKFSELIQRNMHSDLEPFDLVCYSLYSLNSDKELFASFGFGKKFFNAARKAIEVIS